MSQNPILFKNLNILIYGLGKTGISSFKHLYKNNNIFCYDDYRVILDNNLIKKKFLDKKKILNIKFDYIIISPGIDIRKCKLSKFLKKNKKKIITDLDIFYLENKKNFKIAITGTNGKSTTAKILYNILKKNKKDVRLSGNIGKPILEEKFINKKTCFVIEVSSYQMEYSNFFKSNFAVILNISNDHLERHLNIKNYATSKIKLLYKQETNDKCFIDISQNFVKRYLKIKDISSKIINVKLDNLENLKKEIKNKYFHNLSNLKNLQFVLKICKSLKITKKTVINSANNFKSLPYRQQILFKKKNVTCINDSKSTSFASSVDILKSYNKIYWIVGGIPKKNDKLELEKKYYKNIIAFIIGNNSNFFKNEFKNKILYFKFKNFEKLLKKIVEINNKSNEPKIKKCILLSPAAASFDKFKSFEERGKYFNKIIKKIKLKSLINN